MIEPNQTETGTEIGIETRNLGGHALRAEPGAARITTPPSLMDDTRVARSEIEQTRQRMTGTLDAIEDKLVQKKTELQDRLDVLAPAREQPMLAAGLAFGGGLMLGLLTGGDDSDDHRSGGRARVPRDTDAVDYWRERAETWESRSHRLMRIAQEQEDELVSLRGEDPARGRDRLSADDTVAGRDRHRHDSPFDELRGMVVHGLTGVVRGALDQLTGR